MNTQQTFTKLTEQWTRECQLIAFSSDMRQYVSQPAYRELVAMGKPIVPYIIEQYRKDNLPWGFVLEEITGLKMIDNPMKFSPPELKKRWLAWWESESSHKNVK